MKGFFFSNFPIIVFNIYFFNIYPSPTFFSLSLSYNFISPLLLQSFSHPYLFITPLPFTLISFFLFPFVFLYFCLFLFTPSYYKFVTISSILHSFPSPKKKKNGSLSLSLPKFFGGFFFFSCISTLG